MSRLFYNRNHTFNKLFWFFWNYFQDASMPSAENLFLLVISMLALDSFRSIRFAWMHIISRLTGKSLNSFYYTLSYAAFDHLRWTAVTARLVLSCIPISLRDSSVFLSIDDTLVEKYGTKFQARSNLFDHAAHNGSNYLKGHCFVSLMLHVPLKSADGITYLSVPLGYRLWTKELSKLELAADMVRSVMTELSSCRQVILLCDSWYPKKPVTGLVSEFENLEMICCVRSDTVLYDLPGERTGRRGRPRIHGSRLELSSIILNKPEGASYYMGCRKVITNLWKGRIVHAYVTATDPGKPGSFRLFLCTAAPEEIAVEPEKQAEEKICRYNTWGMLPLGLFSLRWNIEISYYETKTFWSFRDYMIRSVQGIERLSNLICISYAAVRMLPYYSKEFQKYQGQSPQEIRYELGEKIRMNLIIHSLGQTIEAIKKYSSLKTAFQELMRNCGYL